MKLTFETAKVYLEQGRKIRRASWPKGIYIRKREMDPDDEDDFLDVEEIVVDEYGDHPLFDDECSWFCPGDFFATDWEVAE